MDFVDDVSGPRGRVLAEGCRVDGVVDFAAGDLGLDVAVHGGEAGGGALTLAGAAGVDDGVAGAGRLSLYWVTRYGDGKRQNGGCWSKMHRGWCF